MLKGIGIWVFRILLFAWLKEISYQQVSDQVINNKQNSRQKMSPIPTPMLARKIII